MKISNAAHFKLPMKIFLSSLISTFDQKINWTERFLTIFDLLHLQNDPFEKFQIRICSISWFYVTIWRLWEIFFSMKRSLQFVNSTHPFQEIGIIELYKKDEKSQAKRAFCHFSSDLVDCLWSLGCFCSFRKGVIFWVQREPEAKIWDYYLTENNESKAAKV